MTGRTLLFGLGAAKSGTSWLYEALRDHPEVHLRGVKELHYFDADTPAAHEKALMHLERHSNGILARISDDPGERLATLRGRIADLEAAMELHEDGGAGIEDYLAYLSEGAGRAKVIGDITPSYALLPVETLRRMAEVAPDTRALFVMRDPVERLWSHIRMHADRIPGGHENHEGMARRVLEDVLGGRDTELSARSDYAGALARMREAFPKGRSLAVFTDDMLTRAGFGRICRFLGIRPISPPVRQVFAGRALAPTKEQRARMLDFLAPQYDFIAKAFGTLPDSWAKPLTKV